MVDIRPLRRRVADRGRAAPTPRPARPGSSGEGRSAAPAARAASRRARSAGGRACRSRTARARRPAPRPWPRWSAAGAARRPRSWSAYAIRSSSATSPPAKAGCARHQSWYASRVANVELQAGQRRAEERGHERLGIDALDRREGQAAVDQHRWRARARGDRRRSAPPRRRRANGRRAPRARSRSRRARRAMSRVYAPIPYGGGRRAARARPRRSTASSVAAPSSARATAQPGPAVGGDAVDREHRVGPARAAAEPERGERSALYRDVKGSRSPTSSSGSLPRTSSLASTVPSTPARAARRSARWRPPANSRRAQHPAERRGLKPDVLEARGEDHERDRRTDVAVGDGRGEHRADQYRGHAADDQRHRSRRARRDRRPAPRARPPGSAEPPGSGRCRRAGWRRSSDTRTAAARSSANPSRPRSCRRSGRR